MRRFSRASSFFTAGTGPMPMCEGSQPAAAQPTSVAMGVRPSSASLSSATIRQAAEASFCWLALPAVTVPFGISTRSLARLSGVTSARKPSSRANVTGSPLRCGTCTGTISSAKRPASQAAAARWWLRSAKASASSRVMP